MFVLKCLISIIFVNFYVFGIHHDHNRVHICLTTPHTMKKVDKYIKECQEDVKVNILREAFNLLHHPPTPSSDVHDVHDDHKPNDHDSGPPISIDEIFELIQHSQSLKGRHPELDKNVEITHTTHADKWNIFSTSHDHHSHKDIDPQVTSDHDHEPVKYHNPHPYGHSHGSIDHGVSLHDNDHGPHHDNDHGPHNGASLHNNDHGSHYSASLHDHEHGPNSHDHDNAHGHNPNLHDDDHISHPSVQPTINSHNFHSHHPNHRTTADSLVSSASQAIQNRINAKQLFDKFNRMKSSQLKESKYINFEMEPHENRRNDTQQHSRQKRWAPNFQFIHPTTVSSHDKRIAGCVMHCLFSRNDAVNKHGWPTLDGLVNFYSEGVHEHGFFMATLRATDYCLTGGLYKYHANRHHSADMTDKCDLSFDVFDCISDKITEYCSEHHYHEHHKD